MAHHGNPHDWSPRGTPVKFNVGVDSGIIQIARNADHLDRGGLLYGKVQELALETARAVWDGKKGAIGTPHGDGDHTVIYDPRMKYDWKEWMDKPGIFLVNLARGDTARPFTLYLGDVGRVDGSIDFPEHTLIGCMWTSEQTLTFLVE